MAAQARLQAGRSQQSPRETVTLLVLFLLAFLPYVNTLFGSFVYDDQLQIVLNPYVHSFRHLREIFGTTVWSFRGAQGISNYYRPLMTFGYLLCYRVAGLVPFTFHLANIVLHALVVLLVFCFLRRLSGERVALIAAGLFALHPIHTESVAWIADVTDLELTVFYLLTFLLYLRLADPGRGFGLRTAMCASYVLALLSKEQAMTLPVLVTLFEHFYQEDRSTTSVQQKVSRYAPLWALAALYIVLRCILLGGMASVVSRPGLSWYEVGLSAVSLTGGYLWKLLWPVHLSAFYVFHKSSHLADRNVLLGVAGLAVCGIVFAALWRRARIVSFALLWIFLTLGPVLNARWMPAGVFAERYLYLPSVGFCWILGWAAMKLWTTNAPALVRPLCRAVPLLLVAVALSYAVKTVARNQDWRIEETLFRQTLHTQADSSLIRSDLGVVYFNKGDMVRAEHEWLEALTAGPANVLVLDNLALLRQRQHRYIEALDYSWRALRTRPVVAMAHVHLAETLALMGRGGEADWQFRIATALSPLSTHAHNSYGKFLVDSGRLDEARNEYERSASVDPTTEAYDQLGDIYLALQDQPRAEQDFRRAIGMNPFDSHAHFALGQILEATGRPGDALHEIESGLIMDPSNPAGKVAAIRLRANIPPHPQALPR
jgi:Tfp pilus assembly protein PilF